MRKKLLSALLSLVLIVALVPTAFATSANSYTDVSTNDLYYPAVMYMSEQKYMMGYSDTEFGPNDTLSRAMFVTILYRVSGEKVSATNTKFTDVAQGTWYTEAVAWAVANNITSGTSTTTFSPNDPVTREQMAVFIKRYVDTKNVNMPAKALFDGKPMDVSTAGNWAQDAVQFAYGFGILIRTNGNVNPKANATRADAVIAFYNFLTASGKVATADLLVPDSYYTGEEENNHEHQWVEFKVDGHYEKVFVRDDIKPVYETRTVYECRRCGSVFNSLNEFEVHAGMRGTDHFDFSNPCLGANHLFYEAKVQISEEKVPVYENKWIPDAIVYKCEICGATK